jgi:hypothetical protein
MSILLKKILLVSTSILLAVSTVSWSFSGFELNNINSSTQEEIPIEEEQNLSTEYLYSHESVQVQKKTIVTTKVFLLNAFKDLLIPYTEQPNLPIKNSLSYLKVFRL